MNKIELLLPGSANKPVALDICYVSDQQMKPVIILIHGFKGFKNWGHYDLIAQHIAESGFVCLKFNFSHNGTTPAQLTDFADLEAFGHNNYSTELSDMQKVLDFAAPYISLYEGNPEQLYLIGHSRGGGIAILTAAKDPRIKKLCTWASVRELGKFVPENEIATWKEKGVITIYNSRTHQDMPLYYQLYEDFLSNKTELDVPAHARTISRPWLILHGSNDQTVPVSAAKDLHALNPLSRLYLLENADHNFGGKHPWTGQELPKDAETALQQTLAFFMH